ncbi:uncharacterized protein ATNIH1004_003569 [Aspergillus tanneri]|uniref:Major facilitator superfamily (MFS) profile domain-containing protein n=1 Tax=Aspergillus tanneri TaxID=1220188 RepID=A0A5M9MZV8_9EURO|nr:uncharacterized protein ATNIH1004_003569 [Aspergillus tanneri]KAA8650880.1 hypothetical protein ATNIH1004_003569 [Aspergillus tanneri]
MTFHNSTEADSSREKQLAELVQLVQSITSPKVHVPSGASEPSSLDGQSSSKSTEEFQQLLTGFSNEGLGSEGFGNAVSLLSQHSVNNSSPGFLGKLVSAPSPPGTAADLFLSIFNNNGHVWRASPALTAVEKHVSGELARLFGLRGPHAGGVTVPGGAASNMLAMLVARNILSPESKQQGVTPGKYAVFVSDAAHYSVSNAAQTVGLGNDSVISVPALDDGTMDVDALEAAVDAAIQSGKTPLFINATAGNTVNGAFDPIDKIGAIARKTNAWFHIDACWGGAVAFSGSLRHLIKGSELADSIAFNPHKMLGVPLVCAFLLTNDLRTFWLANKLNAGYLFHDKTAGKSEQSALGLNGAKENDWRNSKLLDDAPEVADIRDLASLTVQCSRRSDATKLFLHWIYYGTKGIAREVEQAVDSAQHLANLIKAHPRLELIGDTEKVFAQVCFYWMPKGEENGTSSGTRTAAVNSRNTHVLYKHLTEHGWKIDYAPDKVKGEFIRIACNRLTTRRGVEALISSLLRRILSGKAPSTFPLFLLSEEAVNAISLNSKSDGPSVDPLMESTAKNDPHTNVEHLRALDVTGEHEKEDDSNGASSSGNEDTISPDSKELDMGEKGNSVAANPALSHIVTNSDRKPAPPPDGGWKAWLSVLCGHFLFMNTWGFINSFGVFQTYYTTLLDKSPSDISWIGSIQVFLSFFVGAFIGRFIDGGFLRHVLISGTVIVTVGIFTASVSTQYWQLILSQGTCCGLGSGCLVTPAVSVVSTYFEKKRSLAIGLATCGSVTGGLVFSAMARQLIPSAGIGWALRGIGFVQVATLLSVTTFMRPRLPPRKGDRLVEWVAFKELEYAFFTAGMFFNFWAVFFGFYYLASYSRDIITPHFSYIDSLNVLLILNGVGVVGRMIANHFADTMGPLNMMIPTCLIAGIALLSWMAVHTPGQLYAWTVVYGIIAGAILSLFPAGLSSLTTDLSKRGARIGMNFTVVSFATLTGNPIAGAIISADAGKYIGAQVFMGASFLLGGAFIFAARLTRQGKTKGGWWIKI